MSKQYQRLIQIFEAGNINTTELTATNRGKMRPDLIGDNDIE
jgi:hypothetical protein